MSIGLHNLQAPSGRAHKSKRRVGRGLGSRGTFSGRGMKGQRARSGGKRGLVKRSMKAMISQLPKNRGFKSPYSKMDVVNVGVLNELFAANSTITPKELQAKDLIPKASLGVKILGNGKLSKPLTVQANHFSATAKAAIEAAGGITELIVVPVRGQKKARARVRAAKQ